MNRYCFLAGVFLLSLPILADPLDEIAPGSWYEAPNTPMRAVDPCPQRGCAYTGSGGQAMLLGAWGGGAYDTKRDRLLIWGGGHSDYGGNEVYAFGVNTLTWERVTDPSNPPAQDTAYASDGAPGSNHSRNTLQYVPFLDALCIFGFTGYFPSASVSSHNLDAYDFTSGAWVRKAEVPDGGCGRGFTAVDTDGTVWSHGDEGAGKLTHYFPRTDTWT